MAYSHGYTPKTKLDTSKPPKGDAVQQYLIFAKNLYDTTVKYSQQLSEKDAQECHDVFEPRLYGLLIQLFEYFKEPQFMHCLALEIPYTDQYKLIRFFHYAYLLHAHSPRLYKSCMKSILKILTEII